VTWLKGRRWWKAEVVGGIRNAADEVMKANMNIALGFEKRAIASSSSLTS